MRAAHQQRVHQHEERTRIPCGENYERLRRLGVQPFSCYFKDRTGLREPPLMYVDVNVGRGRTGRIGVHEGDDLRVLSRNFARAFQLDRETARKLEDMLYQAYEEQTGSTSLMMQATEDCSPAMEDCSLSEDHISNAGADLDPGEDLASADLDPVEDLASVRWRDLMA